MKRFLCCFAAMLLLILPVSADYTPTNVFDHAALLSDEQWIELDRRAAELTAQYGCQVLVVTVDDMGGYSAEDYAQAYFDYCALGYGRERSCIMLLLSMDERDYDIMAHGSGNYIFTDYGKERLSREFLGRFAADDWFGGLQSFIEGTVYFFENDKAGTPIDTDYDPMGNRFTGRDAFITVGVCFVIALIVLFIMKSKMKTVKRQKAAANYAVSSRFVLRQRGDRFLRRSVHRVRHETPRSGGGGGTHVNSHGSSHHSGKF